MKSILLLILFGISSSFIEAHGNSDQQISGIVPCANKINEMLLALELPKLSSKGWFFYRQGNSHTLEALTNTVGGPGQANRDIEENIPKLQKKLAITTDEITKITESSDSSPGLTQVLRVCTSELQCPKKEFARFLNKKQTVIDRLSILMSEEKNLRTKIDEIKNKTYDLVIRRGVAENANSELLGLVTEERTIDKEFGDNYQQSRILGQALFEMDRLDAKGRHDAAISRFNKVLSERNSTLNKSRDALYKRKNEVIEKINSIKDSMMSGTQIYFSKTNSIPVHEVIKFCHQGECNFPQLDLENCQWTDVYKSKKTASKEELNKLLHAESLGEFCTGSGSSRLVNSDFCKKVALQTCDKNLNLLPLDNRNYCARRGLLPQDQKKTNGGATP